MQELDHPVQFAVRKSVLDHNDALTQLFFRRVTFHEFLLTVVFQFDKTILHLPLTADQSWQGHERTAFVVIAGGELHIFYA